MTRIREATSALEKLAREGIQVHVAAPTEKSQVVVKFSDTIRTMPAPTRSVVTRMDEDGLPLETETRVIEEP